jgi:putative ABC transport system ATP-binding protein
VFERVVVERDGHRALDELSTSVPEDGVTVVAGPSGSGKSTLLRLCNRLEIPTAGRVLFHGDDVADLDPLPLRHRVGMVFQRPTLFGGTVRDNLLVAHPGADDDELAVALDRAALSRQFLERRADELSGGEAQRACLARTLVTGPEVLLMDEPTSSLDSAARLALEELACEQARAGVAVLWVTHDEQQVERIADRVVRIADGRVQPP